MDQIQIFHPAVIVAAISMFVSGGLWYGPLFGKTWMRANGFSRETMKQTNAPLQYALTFLLALIMASNLAFFLGGPDTDWVWGATAGFLAGFGWVALGVAMISIFEQRSWKYVFVNGGYMVFAFTLMGTIIGAWR